MGKYAGQEGEIFALICQKSNELEQSGTTGTKLLGELVKYYYEAVKIIRRQQTLPEPETEEELSFPW